MNRRLLILGVAVIVVWIIAAIWFVLFLIGMPTARADTDLENYLRTHSYYVCQDITNQPDGARVNAIVYAIQAAGFTQQQASDIVWASVTALCPQWTELLARTVAQNQRTQLA